MNKVGHRLVDKLVIADCAVVTGTKTFVHMAFCGAAKQAWP